MKKNPFLLKRCEQCGKFKRTTWDAGVYFCSQKCNRESQKEKMRKLATNGIFLNRAKKEFKERRIEASRDMFMEFINDTSMLNNK